MRGELFYFANRMTGEINKNLVGCSITSVRIAQDDAAAKFIFEVEFNGNVYSRGKMISVHMFESLGDEGFILMISKDIAADFMEKIAEYT